MRRTASIVGVAMVLGLITGSPAQPAPGEQTRIMLVGSSTTHGSAGDYTWRYRLWQHLTGSGVEVDFVGPFHRLFDNVRSTSTSFVESDAYADPAFDRDHNARWGRFLGTYPGQFPGARETIGADVSAYQPNVVVVMLGLNDLTFQTSRTPEDVAGEMRGFIANARAAKPDVRLALVAVQPTVGTQQDRLAEFNRRLSDLATAESIVESPVAYVAQVEGYQPDPQQPLHESYDGVHPNARGEILIADAVASVLSRGFNIGTAIGPQLGFALRCEPGNGKASLTWDESPGATGYWIQRRIVGQPWHPATYQLKLTDQPFTNVWLTNGTTYEYRLQAAKMYDKGVYSTVCAVTPRA